MAVDLPGDDRSLNTRQKLLRFGQGQTQVRDIANIFRPTDFYQIGAWAARVIPGRNQPQHPSHPRSQASSGGKGLTKALEHAVEAVTIAANPLATRA